MTSYPPSDATEGDVFVSRRLAEDAEEADLLLREVRARLSESERLLCVVSVCKISPPLEVLVVTTERMLADDRADIARPETDWSVELPIGEVARIEVTGFMDNVKLVHHDDTGTKVGNLWDGADEEPLQAALVTAREAGTRPDAADQEATYDLYPLPEPEL